MLKERLALLEKQMELRLQEIRLSQKHSGIKGASTEEALREFLRQFLPPYNRVGEGEVVDQNSQISRQIDVIITNEHHPFINDFSKPSTFIIEGVAAVGEVKSILTGIELERSLENSLCFKRLSIKSQAGTMIHSNPEDISRFLDKRPSFLFAFESRISISTIKDRIEKWNRDHNLPITEQIDAIFILSDKSLINFGEGKGALQILDTQGKSVCGYNQPAGNSANSLYYLLAWLSASIQRFTLPLAPILSYLIRDASVIRSELLKN